MRKLLLSLALLAGLVTYAQDPALSITIKADASCMPANSSYNGSITVTGDGMTWTAFGFNNNNLNWTTNPLRCGWKTAAQNAYFSTNSPVTAAIGKVEINVTRTKAGTNDNVDGIYLKVSDNADFSAADSIDFDITDVPAALNGTATLSVDVPQAAANKYYYIGIKTPKASNNGFLALDKVSYYGEQAADAVPVPVITLGENNTVSISAEDGLEVYYTTDGTAPTTASTRYTAPFTINAATTVKAIASNGSAVSAVVTREFLPNVVDGLAEFLDLKNPEATKINTTLTAIYQNGRNLYLTDGNNNFILAYNSNNLSTVTGQFATNGDRMSFITGTYKSQNGLPEIIPTAVGEKTSGTAVEPEEMYIEDIATDKLNCYVRIKDVKIEALSTANNYQATDETGSVVIYNTFANANYYTPVVVEEGEGFTVTGFISCYNNTLQLTPISIEGGQVMETVATPEFTPASGTELSTGDEITISCATEGATIHYTIDGTEPTETSPVYDGSILFDGETMTVKAMAAKEGMMPSEVASATYALYVEGKTSATFRFNEPSTLVPTPEIPTVDNTQIKLCDANANNVFTSGAITLTFDYGTNTNNCPVLIYPTGKLEGKLEGRCYVNNTLVFKATSATITKITFEQQEGSTNWAGFTSNPEATIDGKTFNYAANVSDATLTSTGTNRYVTITVDYINSGSAIDSVLDDDNANAPVEYFNLQGIRVNGDNLTPGIYVRRQGKEVVKVLVK